MNFDEITSKVKKFGKDALVEVQRLNEIRVLKGKISDSKKQINNAYIEIGKKIYEQYKEEALEGFEAEIATISEKLAYIEVVKDELRGVKGVVVCPCCGMDVQATENYCPGCGAKMPEVDPAEDFEEEFEDILDDAEEAMEEAVEETVEEAAEAVEEAVEEAAEAVEEAVEEATEE